MVTVPSTFTLVYPHLPVPFIFGTKLPSSLTYQVPRPLVPFFLELEDEGIDSIKSIHCHWDFLKTHILNVTRYPVCVSWNAKWISNYFKKYVSMTAVRFVQKPHSFAWIRQPTPWLKKRHKKCSDPRHPRMKFKLIHSRYNFGLGNKSLQLFLGEVGSVQNLHSTTIE